MAKLLEDSDSELPELEELLKNTKSSKVAKGAESSTQSTQQLRKQGGCQQHEIDPAWEVFSPTPTVKPKGDQNSCSEMEKLQGRTRKPRRRVLKQRYDNPLLRPISQTSISVTASELPAPKGKRNTKPTFKTHIGDEKESKGQPKTLGNSAYHQNDLLDGDDAGTKIPEQLNVLSVLSTSSSSIRSVSKADYEEDGALDSDGISDFIVNDSSDLEAEDSLVITPPAPRSTRRLVRGRRPRLVEEDEDRLDLRIDQLKIKDKVSKRRPSHTKDLHEEFVAIDSDSDVSSGGSKTREQSETPAARNSRRKASKLKLETPSPRRSSSDVDDQITLHYSPPQSRVRKVRQTSDLATPPQSPEIKPKSLRSPTKMPQRIPATSHRVSMDSFWDQEVINQWNEEYSPQKTIKASRPNVEETSRGGSLLFPIQKSPAKQAQAVRAAKKRFSDSKHALARSFLTELDNVVTDGQVSKLAASTGGVQIIWSKKLNTTAGRANWKRESIQSILTVDGKAQAPRYRQFASIELAEKVIDDEHRLFNVLAHEFCHLANFMVSNIRTNPHGKEFKAWASKCSEHFGDRGIEVTTKHSYEIDYKYVWECENCGLIYKRHSKSIDPTRHRCGTCKSKLVQLKPIPRGNGEKKVSAYQAFLKANMDRVKRENPGSPQKEIMGLVARSYHEHKASNLGDSIKERTSIGISEVHLSRDGTPEDEGDLVSVVKKLNFLDLTSP